MPTTPAADNQTPDIFALSEAYVLGRLDQAQTNAFNALLLSDADAREQCILTIDIMSTVNEEFRRREENAELNAAEPLLQDFNATMNDLLRMEQQAQVIDHPFEASSFSEPPRPTRDDNPTVKDLISVAGYLSAKAIKSRPAQWLAAAAVVLLGVTLFIALSGNDPAPLATTEQNKPAAAAQSTPHGSDTQVRTTVATLTNTKDAQWAEGALAPGSDLRPGQRLTLTQGFAEITTNDGAIAILEAPATIELTDSNNAIRLHSGKLVGLCHTASSKGFVVRTDHADITDIGTEFGVSVTSDSVEATVFVGDVEIETSAGLPKRLTANQTATLTINGNSRELVIEDHIAAGFDALRDQQVLLTASLRGTGEGLAANEEDPYWRIIAIDGQVLDNPIAMLGSRPSANVPNPLAPSRLVQQNPADGKTDTVCLIETNLQLPDSFDPDRLQLVIRFRVDNELLSLKVNGKAIDVPKQNTNAFGRDDTVVIDGPLRPGDNHFVFEVKNTGVSSLQNNIGLQVAWELQPVPTQQPEQTP